VKNSHSEPEALDVVQCVEPGSFALAAGGEIEPRKPEQQTTTITRDPITQLIDYTVDQLNRKTS